MAGIGTIQAVLFIVLILYIYLWLHDKEKAWALTQGLFRVVWMLILGLYRVLSGIIGYVMRLFGSRR